MKRIIALSILLLVVVVTTATAASPPDPVNIQGVLRDNNDDPQDGTFDMVFRLFDSAGGLNEILVDTHTLATVNPVTVTGGLFNVPLGSGVVTDGAGTGLYNLLTRVFADFEEVWGEVPQNYETIRVLFEVRYDDKQPGDGPILSDVYYDNLYMGPAPAGAATTGSE